VTGRENNKYNRGSFLRKEKKPVSKKEQMGKTTIQKRIGGGGDWKLFPSVKGLAGVDIKKRP